MADNTVIPPAAGGDTIRTMDRGTSKTQVVALDYGPDAGPESLVSVSNGLPVAQQGTWTVAGSGTFTVAGAVTVSNFPATQPVSGTFWQATQPVSGTVAATQSGAWTTGRTWTLASGTDSVAAVQFGAWSVAQSGAWTVGVSGTVTVAGAVSVSNFPATQPVSGTVTVSNLPGPGPAPSSGSLSVVIAPDQVVPVQFNPDGLGPAGMDTSLPVTLALDQPPIPVQALPTGQLPMQQSVSVTLASDQTLIPVIANQGVSPFNIAGAVSVSNFPATQAISGVVTGTVAVSNLPATQAMSVATLPLPANAAQETSGNLAALVTLTQQMQQLIELNKMSLAALRANNLLLASLGGASVNPGDLLDDVTFQ